MGEHDVDGFVDRQRGAVAAAAFPEELYSTLMAMLSQRISRSVVPLSPVLWDDSSSYDSLHP